jgi:preprotein translocase subunit YajC
MADNPIIPSQVTKPIQLLAAWLAGLLAINGSYLVAAANIHQPNWAPAALVIASIVHVPLFLTFIFLLQTKFRPEMQEDQFYAQHLKRTYSVNTDSEEVVSVSSISESELITKIDPDLPRISVDKSGREKININSLLENYVEIRKSLISDGLEINKIFGIGDQSPPDEYIMSIGGRVSVDYVRRILTSIKDNPPKYIGSSNSSRRPTVVGSVSGSVVYIGSYIYRTKGYYKVEYTEAVRRKLFSKRMTDDGLQDLISPRPSADTPS